MSYHISSLMRRFRSLDLPSACLFGASDLYQLPPFSPLAFAPGDGVSIICIDLLCLVRCVYHELAPLHAASFFIFPYEYHGLVYASKSRLNSMSLLVSSLF